MQETAAYRRAARTVRLQTAVEAAHAALIEGRTRDALHVLERVQIPTQRPPRP